MRRQHYVHEKRKALLASEEADSSLWERVLSNINPFAPIRKRKVVFVGLEAAGKVRFVTKQCSIDADSCTHP